MVPRWENIQMRLFHVVTFLALLSVAAPAFGCGLSWKVPTTHFNGVNSQGYVSYSEKIGDLDLGNNQIIPLIITFKSSEQGTSPYLGKGWKLNLLESGIVQTGEDTFVMLQPDGWTNLFRRDSASSTTLRGSAGWRAEISGDTITAWPDCGWKLQFRKGRIATLTTPDNRKLEFAATATGVTAIRENGATLFSVETTDKNEVRALTFNGKRMVITQGDKPRVQRIAAQNVVAGIDQSLESIESSDGPTKKFEFAVNKDIEPTLKIVGKDAKERLIIWDPATQRMRADGDWRYAIKPGVEIDSNAAITRTTAAGVNEYWFLDPANGKETTQTKNGPMIVNSWFTSGTLAGKLRNIESTAGGHTEKLLHLDYDEQGRPLRKLLPKGMIQTYDYGSNGKKVTLTNPTPSPGDTFRVRVQYYDSKNREIKCLVDDKLTHTVCYDPDGKWEQRDVYDPVTQVKQRSFYREYNEMHKMAVQTVSEFTGASSVQIKKFFYNKLGTLTNSTTSYIKQVQSIQNQIVH